MPAPYGAQLKGQVIAALMTGESVHAVARQFGVSRATIISWRRGAGLERPTVVQPQNELELGRLVVEHVRTSLLALAAQARVAADEKWIAKQSAADLAVLFGVMSDKTHRILAALQPVGDDTAID